MTVALLNVPFNMKKGLGNASKRPLHSGAANHPSQPAMDLIALGSKPKDGRSLGNDSSSMTKMHCCFYKQYIYVLPGLCSDYSKICKILFLAKKQTQYAAVHILL